MGSGVSRIHDPPQGPLSFSLWLSELHSWSGFILVGGALGTFLGLTPYAPLGSPTLYTILGTMAGYVPALIKDYQNKPDRGIIQYVLECGIPSIVGAVAGLSLGVAFLDARNNPVGRIVTALLAGYLGFWNYEECAQNQVQSGPLMAPMFWILNLLWLGVIFFTGNVDFFRGGIVY